jgi:predicted secreted protein
MSLAAGLVTYVIIWWCVFFMVLPWGNRPADRPEAGHAESAPAKPRLWWKASITTATAVVLWVIAYHVISSDIVSFRP